MSKVIVESIAGTDFSIEVEKIGLLPIVSNSHSDVTTAFSSFYSFNCSSTTNLSLGTNRVNLTSALNTTSEIVAMGHGGTFNVYISAEIGSTTTINTFFGSNLTTRALPAALYINVAGDLA